MELQKQRLLSALISFWFCAFFVAQTNAQQCDYHFNYARMKTSKSIVRHTVIFIEKFCPGHNTAYYIYEVSAKEGTAVIQLFETKNQNYKSEYFEDVRYFGQIRNADWGDLKHELFRVRPIQYFNLAVQNCRYFVRNFMHLWTGEKPRGHIWGDNSNGWRFPGTISNNFQKSHNFDGVIKELNIMIYGEYLPAIVPSVFGAGSSGSSTSSYGGDLPPQSTLEGRNKIPVKYWSAGKYGKYDETLDTCKCENYKDNYQKNCRDDGSYDSYNCDVGHCKCHYYAENNYQIYCINDGSFDTYICRW